MDKFLIDSHKYSFHPGHASTVLNYYKDSENDVYRSQFKSQHPLYIEISPVGACNHRCTFCAVDYIGYKSIFMDFEAYKNSVGGMSGKGCKSIMFAGEGEPLLHPKITEFVNYTKTCCNIDVSFTTNAYKLTEGFVEQCIKNISWIKVSFNGGDKDTYSRIHQTKESDFDIVSKNIGYAVEYKKRHSLSCAIGLQTLLLPENADSMHSLCKHAKNLGADYLVIKPYSQHKFSNTDKYSDIDYTQYLGLKEELAIYNDESFNVVFRANTINNWMSQNNNRYCKCLATPATWAYWMADGEVYSCSAYLLDERFRLGNINQKGFSEIWESEKRLEHANFVKTELNIEECRVNCRMDQVNRYLDSIANEEIQHMNFI